ncbi:MAG: type II toxin-antitoxin system VapC family toxin [Planctomycetes bacterium]|nr:type II toxin-antitoxin system VapC family toxin [Planctomycetota bacterium]
MPQYFLDTSALVKHYHAEVGTAKVDAIWSDAASKLFISRLSVVETVSVFAKKLRIGMITAKDFDLLRRRFFADLRSRRPITVRLLVRHFQDGDRLLQRHGPTHGLYTLDALQLAVALDLQRQGMFDEVVAADHVMVTLGPLEGLKVLNPESP